MNSMDQIWVRACKSKNPTTRLRSVYRRFYYAGTDLKMNDRAILSILSAVADKYTNNSMLYTITALEEAEKFGASYITVPMNAIRFTKRDAFVGIKWKDRP